MAMAMATGRARRTRGGGVAATSSVPTLPVPTNQTRLSSNNNVGRSAAARRRRGGGSSTTTIPALPGTSDRMRPSPSDPTNNNNDNKIGRSAAARRRRGTHSSVVTVGGGITGRKSRVSCIQSKPEEAMLDLTRNDSNRLNDNDDTDSDEEEVIEMPPLVPRDCGVDKVAIDDKANPSAYKYKNTRSTYDHAKSNPTTKAGAELRSIGLKVAGFDERRQCRVGERTNNERFSASFGVSAKTLEAVFVDLNKKNPTITQRDFLMAVDTLKLYLVEHNMAGRWDCHEQTYRKKWKEVVAAIAALRSEKIKFDPSDFPEDQIFLLTVDGVNFRIREPRVKNPGSHWYDHKSNSAGLTYLIAVDVRRSRICWIDGPRPGECVQ